MKITSLLRFVQIILFIFLNSAFLHIDSASANDLFKSLTIDDGLAHTDANCVAQDSTGLIWVGTNSGLQSFNGYQLQTIDYYPPGQKVYMSHNRINALQCSNSRLWIGSDSGLTCLDLKTHLYIPYTVVANDHSVLSERIVDIAIDVANNLLWVFTQGRLCVVRMEESTNTLTVLNWENDYDREIAWNKTKPILYEGQLWMLAGDYLVQMGIDDNKVKIMQNYNMREIIGSHVSVNALFATAGYLYLRSSQGCYRFGFKKNKPDLHKSSYIDFHATDAVIPNYTSGFFVVDRDGTLWCNYFGGLFEVVRPFSENTDIRIYLGNNKNVNFSQSRISSLFIDTYNNLWISTMNRGLYYCSLLPSPFRYIPRQKLTDMGFSKSEVSAIIAQDDSALWIIMEGGSLLRYDIRKEKTEYISLTATQGAIDGLQTLALSADRQRLYIGLAQGIIVYEINTGRNYWLVGKDSKIVLNYNISIAKLVEDQYGRLWASSWGQGVYCIKDPHTSHPSLAYQLNNRTKYAIASDFATDMYVEKNNVLIGTTKGLNKIWLDQNGDIRHISTYQADSRSAHSMSSDYIACIDPQNDSIYWVGTIGGGVNRMTIHSEKDNDYSAVVYTKDDGLTSNDCEIVFLDHKQNVWIGGNAITCLNPATKKVAVYELADGLQSNSFKIGVGYKSPDGTIYMGGIGGLNYFNPRDFSNSHYPVGLNLCNLYVNNQQVSPQKNYDGEVILPTILNKAGSIRLTYKQNNFIISYSAFGYNLSNRIMYRYRMNGYDKDWQTVPYTTDRAFYSNLPYGNYTFELQVSTDRGFSWKEPGRIIEISVLPPWWLTGWAKLSYVILFLSITTLIVYQYNKEQRLKRENHIQELQRVNDEEKYQSKMRFFMNVSHELKTPLTLIMLAAERMAEFNLSKECMAILSNSRKMLSLITELVDIRKADLGLNEMVISRQSMSELIGQMYTEMSPWAEKKHITIEYQPEKEDIKMDFDRDKIGKLVINLISNAVKYTPEGGRIKLALRKGTMKEITPMYASMHREGEIPMEQQVCILTIQDNGVGISPESIRYIYERFFQVKDTNLTHLGSGIGLAIAKNMVLLHKGCVIVSSQRSVGTEFIVALPIATSESDALESSTDASCFNTKEFIDSQYLEYIPSESVEGELSSEQPLHSGLPTVLIVEDNEELQKALSEQLSSHYQVHIADNGKVGLEMCESLYPDIIISDVMMPEMDGVEMCKRIRDNLSIAYIPIILLTAKGDVEHQIEGYESGADLYIPKPFSIKLLEVNIKRLLTQKERWLKQEYQPLVDETEDPEEKNSDDADARTFEKQLKQLIENNMGNSNFSIDFLCNELRLGRTKLYNKMKEFSEQPLADYIRNIRLERTVYLLKNTELNINEVMFEVGFINSSHFSKIFKQKYGVSPTEYKKQSINN